MLTIQKTYLGEVVVFTLSGRLDGINAPQIRQELDRVIENGVSDRIVLRMSEVNYLSAAALRVLRYLHETSGRVCIAEPSKRVREVMQITGLDHTYDLYANLSEAMHVTHPVLNAHTRLEMGWLENHRPKASGKSYAVWLNSWFQALTEVQKTSFKIRYVTAIETGIRQLQAAGISTIAEISTTGLSIEPLIKAGMRGTVYIELHSRRPNDVADNWQTVQHLIERWQPQMPTGLNLGIAIHAPYAIERELWQKTLAYVQKNHLPLCIPVAESADEVQFLQDGGGSLKEIFSVDDGFTAPGLTPIAFLEEMGALALKPLLLHAIHVTDADLARIKTFGCTVVHCPRSNLRLLNGRMPLEKFIEFGIPVLLGTGSLFTSPSLNVFEEMEFAIALHHQQVTPEKIVQMAHGVVPTLIASPDENGEEKADDKAPEATQAPDMNMTIPLPEMVEEIESLDDPDDEGHAEDAGEDEDHPPGTNSTKPTIPKADQD